MLFAIFMPPTHGQTVGCDMNPCQKECLPPGVRWRCIQIPKSDSEPERRLPIVEGQRILYLNFLEGIYSWTHPQMEKFFTDWASRCPGDKSLGANYGRTNTVYSAPEVLNSSTPIPYLQKRLFTIRPHTVVMQFDDVWNTSETFGEQVLAQIPRSLGCFILSPAHYPLSAATKESLLRLEKYLSKTNHNCQILNATPQLAQAQEGCLQPSSQTKYKRCVASAWVLETQRQSCDYDPRSFSDSATQPTTTPPQSSVGN